MDPLFRASNLHVRRGGRSLFQNLSFVLNKGSILHLKGPNGVGKTSLLRILCGGLVPDSGQLLWQGQECFAEGMAAHAARCVFLPADDRAFLKPRETVAETLAFWAGIWGVPQQDVAFRSHQVLSCFDLASLTLREVRALSAGQRRRLSLACAFLKQAPLWLLDEPLNGLDAKAAGLFYQALRHHSQAGGGAVIASHVPLDVSLPTEILSLKVCQDQRVCC